MVEHSLLKRVILLHSVALQLTVPEPVPGLCSVPLICWLVLSPAPQCPGGCSYMVRLEVRQCRPPAPVFSFSIVWASLALFPLLIKFKVSLLVSTKKLDRTWVRIKLNVQVEVGRTGT